MFLRNATAYGSSPRLRTDLMVNNLVGYALTTGEVLIKSDGTPWRPLVHIEDIAQAVLAVLRAPRERIHNQAFNVGADAENYRVREVADLVEELVPGSRVAYAADAGPDMPQLPRRPSARSPRALPDFRAPLDGARRHRGADRRLPPERARGRGFPRRSLQPDPPSAPAAGARAQLDATLRRRAAAALRTSA